MRVNRPPLPQMPMALSWDLYKKFKVLFIYSKKFRHLISKAKKNYLMLIYYSILHISRFCITTFVRPSLLRESCTLYSIRGFLFSYTYVRTYCTYCIHTFTRMYSTVYSGVLGYTEHTIYYLFDFVSYSCFLASTGLLA